MKIKSSYTGMIIACVCTLLISACTAGNGENQAKEPLPQEQPDTPQSSSAFKKIQDEIFTPKCATSGCHNGTASPLGLNLVEGKAYNKLVNKPSNQVDGLQLVESSNIEASYLVHKLEGTQGGGAQMPLGKPPLSTEEIQLIKTWISDGALETSSGGDLDPTQAKLSSIQSNIFDIHCISCHSGDNPAGTLNLESGMSYDQLVDRPLQFDPDGSILVMKNNANKSLLINKLTGIGLGDPADSNYKGERMPLNGPYLDEASIQTIKDWINAAAINN